MSKSKTTPKAPADPPEPRATVMPFGEAETPVDAALLGGLKEEKAGTALQPAQEEGAQASTRGVRLDAPCDTQECEASQVTLPSDPRRAP